MDYKININKFHLSYFNDKNNNILIIGNNNSGKTTLVQTLLYYFHKSHSINIMTNESDIKKYQKYTQVFNYNPKAELFVYDDVNINLIDLSKSNIIATSNFSSLSNDILSNMNFIFVLSDDKLIYEKIFSFFERNKYSQIIKNLKDFKSLVVNNNKLYWYSAKEKLPDFTLIQIEENIEPEIIFESETDSELSDTDTDYYFNMIADQNKLIHDTSEIISNSSDRSSSSFFDEKNIIFFPKKYNIDISEEFAKFRIKITKDNGEKEIILRI